MPKTQDEFEREWGMSIEEFIEQGQDWCGDAYVAIRDKYDVDHEMPDLKMQQAAAGMLAKLSELAPESMRKLGELDKKTGTEVRKSLVAYLMATYLIGWELGRGSKNED